ncbi:MAG: hypothetical protein HY313_04655 [Acidobacteria bacterium]|nr:hypothetical protein [Acidobacteriota bacterium]
MRKPSRESQLREEANKARSVTGALLENLLYHRAPEVLEALLENPHLGERQLALLLSRRDLSREIVARIAQNKEWMKSYRLKLALVKHPRTPRHLALPLLKLLYLFDLMGIAITEGVPAELKRLAEDAILAQREGIALGQRLTLARRGSQRIAAGLLNDSNREVIEAALLNPALTEHSIAAALLREQAIQKLTEAVVAHPRWSNRYLVKVALLRNQHLSLGRFIGILSELPINDLVDLAADPRVASNLREYVARVVETRRSRTKTRRIFIQE